MAKEGLKYFLSTLILAIVFLLMKWWFVGGIVAFLSLYVAFFFRDPSRNPTIDSKAIYSPADGKVIYLGEDIEKDFLNESCVKISVFMSLFDVHINRAPVSGIVKGIKYFKGEFKAVYDDGVSNHNERNLLLIENTFLKMVVSQVAGLVARRIVCDVREGDQVQQGRRYGLIQFGSRCDLFLPKSVLVRVKLGDKVKAGQTVLARLP